jgi:two-component system sensor histidine kinase AlgZ
MVQGVDWSENPGNMKDTQILSAFMELTPEVAHGAESAPLVFDACQLGVVLRAVLFVEAVTALTVAFNATHAMAWVELFSLVTAGTLPATLSWLVVACMTKRWMADWTLPWQAAFAAGLGALSGLYGCAILWFTGLVQPAPWWASAMGGVGVSLVLVAGLVMRARGRAPADTAARLSELQSRIRPHFLFNTLNSAIALVRAEPARAEALLEDLSDLFRHALADKGATVTLAAEIALAQRYLAIEQVRFGERLRVEWDIDCAADGALLPPLLLQPLVENAVLHGVEPSDAGADIKISTQARGSRAVIKVTNTVPAGPGAKGMGVALGNVRDRLSLLHDVQGQFRSGMRGGVYQVRMEVPL